jgi:phospholipase/carboxylesterase
MSHTENDNPAERSLVAAIKLYYDLVLPHSTPISPGPYPLLIVLHGYGGSKRQMMREAQLIAPRGFAIVSLQGPHQHLKDAREKGGPLRYGFGWLSNFHPEESIALHHNALLDLTASLIEENLANPQRIFLLGFSQSCALNYRFAFTHTKPLRGVIGICGGLPGDWETSTIYKPTDAAVLHLHGTQDEFYPPARTSDYPQRLRTRAHDVEVKAHNAGHLITHAMRDDVRGWLKRKSEL